MKFLTYILAGGPVPERAGSTEMDESFFPVLWTEDGYRSAFIDGYLGAVPGAPG